ncbi:MAG: glutamyl-tRNA synthetase [Clostridia bacterium]|nr:glutamyl-tRNA synthetase [Clostridia bacterium]
MDNSYLAQLLFPNIDKTPEDLEKLYPPRNLPKGAKVTRIAPSPTGFIHVGNLFGALVDERLAHQSGGIFYLRIEDTDQKRKVEGAIELIINSFKRFGFKFDEGFTEKGDLGQYGPYEQRQRAEIYQTIAKDLVKRGFAYPCFCTEEELDEAKKQQALEGANPGYYGKWAKHRDISVDEVDKELKEGKPFVLRLRSPGNPEKYITVTDLAKGPLEIPENNLDIVLLKSDGIPTYHFAHVVDDHFMRTTHVVRGEEWLSTFSWHLQLFEVIGWEKPFYIHTAHLLKSEGESKRKLSKRKDPEFGLQFYDEQGYPVPAVLEYLMTLLNSNYEEWHTKNPGLPFTDFKFTTEKMSASGALVDMDKLLDISRNVVSKMSEEEVYTHVCEWAEKYDNQFIELLNRDPEYAKSILAIGRGGAKPRKDLSLWSRVKDYMDFFYDELFYSVNYYPDNLENEDIYEIITKYIDKYDYNDDQSKWFEKIRSLAEELGFAGDMKAFKNSPAAFKGNVGDVAMVLRIAVTGRTMSPDTYAVMKILGKDRVVTRLNAAAMGIKK